MSLSLAEVGSIITSIAAFIGVIIAFAKLYLEQQRFRREIELTKQYLKNLSKLVEAYVRNQESQQQIEKQKFDWKKLTDIGNALWKLAESDEE